VVGVTIFFVGILTARVVSRSVLIGAVNRGLPAARLLATLTRAGIILLSSAVALEHVGIGRTIVPSAMLILLAGVTFSLALAVGLGTRDLVGRWIEDQVSPPRRPTPTKSSTGSHHHAAGGATAAAVTSRVRPSSGSTW